MSLTPKDMDFIEAKHVAAREIALALGVPPMLLAIPGDNTYSNYQEATRTFWRQTVLPLVNRTAKALSQWLAPAFSSADTALSLSKGAGTLELRPDLDAIEALSTEREALWSRIDKATFLTANEKRSAVGYGPISGGDEIKSAAAAQKFNPHHDDRGRFTFGPNPDAPQPAQGRRPRAGRGQGTPAQQARLAAANARAQEAMRQLRELEPDWQGPKSFVDPENIEGRISHQEATAQAAEERLAEILRDAIPNTNPSWGVNRLTKELYDQGYVLEKSTRSPGLLYTNPETGEQVRIMERPPRSFRTDSPQKHSNDYYYRYRPSVNDPYGSAISVPNK
jgi:hypothetical protein